MPADAGSTTIVAASSGSATPPPAGNDAETSGSSTTTDGSGAESGSSSEGTSVGEPPPPIEPPPPGTFVDVTEQIGIDAPHVAGGSITGQAWGDYDRDGDLDLFVTGGADRNRLFRNRGDGSFEPVSLLPGAALPGPGKGGVTWADYDNDGWLDLYITVLGTNALLHNEQGESLVPVVAGVEDEGHGRSSAWADYDGDGRLDLYVVNGGDDPDVLYHGEPDGTFTDRSALLPLPWAKPGYAATWVDYDDDGDPDLYVVNDHGTINDLWRNNGPGPDGQWNFSNVSWWTGADLAADAMGIAVGDYDGDGDLDLFSSDIHRTNLLRNELRQGQERFIEVAEEAGLSHDSVNWGAAWIDVELDGWLDLYLATQHTTPPDRTNRLYRNRGDGTFADVSEGCGCAIPGFTTGVAAGDYDGDGLVDLVIGNWTEGYRVLHNEAEPAEGAHWLVVELVGGGPVNRDAIGAKVTVRTRDGRRFVAERRSGSSLGAGDMLPLHFGLGTSEVDEITVRWPDGTMTRHDNVPSDEVWVGHYPE